MTKKDKKNLEEMLNGFESALEELESSSGVNDLDDLVNRIAMMDASLSSFEVLEA